MRRRGRQGASRNVPRPGSFVDEDAEEAAGRRRKIVRSPVIDTGFMFVGVPASTSAHDVLRSGGTDRKSSGFAPPPANTFGGFDAGALPPPYASVSTPLADLEVGSFRVEPTSTSAVGRLRTDAAFFFPKLSDGCIHLRDALGGLVVLDALGVFAPLQIILKTNLLLEIVAEMVAARALACTQPPLLVARTWCVSSWIGSVSS